MANNKKKENVYDPLEDIKRFTYNKGLYDQAVAKGDNVAARQYGDAGMTGYINLQNNGYGDLAKQLGDTDYQGALKIQNEYSKKGKVPIRDYFLGSKLKTQYGMTDQQINDNFKFDESTGEVSFGGMKLGSPYSNVDGTTYWDSGVLDKYIDDYIGYSGITPVTTSVDTKTQQLSDLQFSDHNNMNTKYDELYDFSMNANPFETDTGKAIMDEYSLKALQGKENELASGASSNSGNIDSYSQANALRQQAALTSKGQQMAIAAQSQRINDVRGVLGDLGGYQSNSYKGIQNTIGMQMEDEQRLRENQLERDRLDYDILTDKLDKGITPSLEEVQKLGFNSVEEFTNDYKNNNADNKVAAYRKELYNDVLSGMPITQEDLTKAGYDGMTVADYYTQIAGNNSLLNEDEIRKSALSQVISLASSGAPIPADLLQTAGYGDISSNAFYETFNAIQRDMNKDASSRQALSDIYSALASGYPITKEQLDAAGFTGYTPSSFAEQYLKNLGPLYEMQKKNNAVSTGSGVKPKEKEKISQSLKEKIIKNIDNGGEGLTTLLDTIDWDKYNAEDAYNFIMNNWGDDAEIKAATNKYFNVDAYDEGNVSARAKLIADGINAKYHTITNGKTYVTLSRASDGTYKVNGNQKEIIQAVVNDGKLSDSEKLAALDILGITQDDLEKYIK